MGHAQVDAGEGQGEREEKRWHRNFISLVGARNQGDFPCGGGLKAALCRLSTAK